MVQRVYLETSVITYLTAWPSRDLLVAANQQVTHGWWRKRRREFSLFISEVVIEEAGRGDMDAAKARLDILADAAVLEMSADALEMSADALNLAKELIRQKALPRSATEDALHIAIAATNGVDYLLTWNFRHMANAVMQKQVAQICRDWDYEPPVICSPQALLEG